MTIREIGNFGWLGCSGPLARDVQQLILASYKFFNQPVEHKSCSSESQTLTGYRPIGIEYARWPERFDQMETFSISGAHMESGPRFPLPNEASVMLYSEAASVFKRMHVMGVRLIQEIFAQTLRRAVSVEWLRDATMSASFLQINHYRMLDNLPRPAQDVHEDANLVTIGIADEAGLEIETEDENFVSAQNNGGNFVYMVGGVLSLLVGSIIRPCFHRVIAAPGVNERMSVQLFVSPNPDSASKGWPYVEGVEIQKIITDSNKSGLSSGLQIHSEFST